MVISVESILALLVLVAIFVCLIFWGFSHAPSKINQTTQRAKMRKWSTIVFVILMAIALLWFPNTATINCIVLAIILAHIAFDTMIIFL